MANWRVAPALFLAGFLTASLFSALAVAPRRVAGAAPYDEQVFIVDDGLTVQSHKMTYQEMLASKQIVGVRDPNKNYNIIVDGHGTGLAPPTNEEWSSMVATYDIVDRITPKGPTLSSLDLSASTTFPKVGNQAGQGSCAAWSATYYTYGYMESDDNGWTDAKSGNVAHLLSAAWTYNKVNGGHDWGSWMSTNMGISVDWGTATLATMPYNDGDPVSWGSMEAFREAPLHRADMVHSLSYNGGSTVDTAKALLQAGHPIAYAMDAGQFGPSFSDGNYIMSSVEYNSWTLNHAQTIVGFDDSITDDGEVGAFKIVNSWGAGWGDKGFYWMTYEAFKELGSIGILNATYIDDLVDYVPAILSIWHFDAAPTRSASLGVGIGPHASPIQTKSPYFEAETANNYPTFMALDISEFKGYYDSGNKDFFLNIGSSASNGVISDFKIELYEGGYTPGEPTQASGQSSNIPKNTPGYVTNTLVYYPKILEDAAFDHAGLVFSSTTYVKWVTVPDPSGIGGTVIQSGDVGDSKSSDILVSLDGPLDFWFDWKISSETGSDALSFSIDGAKQVAISGDLTWQTMHYSVAAGPHLLKWEYAKSSMTSQRGDSGWIDNFVVDNLPPMTTVSLAGTRGNSEWFRSSVAVTLTASDGIGSGVSYTEYRVDGGVWRVYSSPFAVSGDGPHVIDYYSVDVVGNTEATRQETVKIDITAPATSPSLSGTLGSAAWYTTQVIVNLQTVDTLSGVNWTRYRLDSGTWQYGSGFLLSADGQHILEYQSQDAAGNMESVGMLSIKIDKVRPLTSLTLSGTTGDSNWYTTGVGVSLASSDSTSGIDFTGYRIDGATWQIYTGFFTITTDGVHVIEYYSQDYSGNREPIQNATVKVDQLGPVLVMTQADGTIYGTSSVNLAWSSVDATSGLNRIETSLDGAAYATHSPMTMSLLLSGLGEGSHTLVVHAVDEAGLMTEKSTHFVVDTVPPASEAMSVGTEGLNTWFVSTVTVDLAANDATTGVRSTQYRVDGGLWQNYLGPFTIITDGDHVVEYRSADNAGNVEGVKQIGVKIDTAPPSTVYALESIKGLNDWYVTYVKVSLTASDASSGVAWSKSRIDGGDWMEYLGPFLVTTDGTHTVEFYSQDVSGHVEFARSIQMKLDCSAPDLQIISPGGDIWGTKVNITWEGGDLTSGLDGFEMSIDGGTSQPMGTATNALRNLSLGPHTITVKAADLAGNVDQKEFSFNVYEQEIGIINGIPGMPSFMYVLIGAMAVAMAALIAAIGVRRRRKSAEDNKVMPANRTSMRVPPPPEDLPPPPRD